MRFLISSNLSNSTTCQYRQANNNANNHQRPTCLLRSMLHFHKRRSRQLLCLFLLLHCQVLMPLASLVH